MAGNFFQRSGNFWEQRRETRAAALTALRKREGLPSPVDENNTPLETRFDDQGHAHYYDQAGKKVDRVLWAGAGKDGAPGGLAVGTRKGEVREVADAHWNSPDGGGFEILEVAEDGRKLADELKDLDRDSAIMEIASGVDHGPAGEQAPEFHLKDTDDVTVDAGLQEYIKNHAR